MRLNKYYKFLSFLWQQVVLGGLTKTQKPQTVVVTTSSRQMDFLTSALSQANIDLDSYHFVEEDDLGNTQQGAAQGTIESENRSWEIVFERVS